MAEQSWDSWAAGGSQGLVPCPVTCSECQGCACAGAGNEGCPHPRCPSCLPGSSCLLRWALAHCSSPKVATGGSPGAPLALAGDPSSCPSPGVSLVSLTPSLSCLCRGCALPDGRGTQADPEPAGGDGECPAQHVGVPGGAKCFSVPCPDDTNPSAVHLLSSKGSALLRHPLQPCWALSEPVPCCSQPVQPRSGALPGAISSSPMALCVFLSPCSSSPSTTSS